MDKNNNLKTKYYTLHFRLAVVIAILGLGLCVASIFMDQPVITLLLLVIGIIWLLVGGFIAVYLYTSYCELADDTLTCKKFKKVTSVKLESISKVDVFGTEYKVYDSNEKVFCTIDRGAINGEEILDALIDKKVNVIIKQI